MSSKVNILVVDDTPANLEVVTETLVSHSYVTAAAISGERAIKRLERYVPELILLDVQMPGIDGFETCRRIKQNPDWAAIPIIFLTALADTDSIVKGFSLGAVDYLTKPFREAELLARVTTHLRLSQLTYQLEQQVEDRTQALQSAMDALQTSQLQLVQQEKMSALGNMVAGVAHEINNPIGFVQGNVRELQRNLTDIFDHLKLYRQQASVQDIENHGEAVDIDFLLEDMPKMLTSMETGCDRISNISVSLRTFSRTDQDTKTAYNLHEGLDSTLLILKYRLKDKDFCPAIQVLKDYGNLPEVSCFPGQLNQVFMNLLANAIDMLDEMAVQKSDTALHINPQQITLRTRQIEDPKTGAPWVEICITDNGKGMSAETCAKIFDRHFTTKAVGKGTGLGLAIARQILVETHQGRLDVHSEVGQGTEFRLQLPV